MADEAAAKVSITYTDCKTPIISIQDAIEGSSFFSDQIVDEVFGDPDGKLPVYSNLRNYFTHPYIARNYIAHHSSNLRKKCPGLNIRHLYKVFESSNDLLCD